MLEGIELISKGNSEQGQSLLKGLLDYTTKHALDHLPKIREIRKCCYLNLSMLCKDRGDMLGFVIYMFKFSKFSVKSNEHYFELAGVLLDQGFVHEARFYLKLVGQSGRV